MSQLDGVEDAWSADYALTGAVHPGRRLAAFSSMAAACCLTDSISGGRRVVHEEVDVSRVDVARPVDHGPRSSKDVENILDFEPHRVSVVVAALTQFRFKRLAHLSRRSLLPILSTTRFPRY